jgi:hypothetical protein
LRFPSLALTPLFACALLGWTVETGATPPGGGGEADVASGPVESPRSELRDLVERFATDRGALQRRYPVEPSTERTERVKGFYAEWQARVRSVAFEPLGVEGRIDYVLLRNRIDYELRLLARG